MRYRSSSGATKEVASVFADLPRRFERRAKTHALRYQLRPPASAAQIQEAEQRLGLRFPEPVRLFYSSLDGLVIESPFAVEVFPLARLVREPRTGWVPFAKVYERHAVVFDATQVNEAKQWSVLFARTGYLLTRTMGSFIENKLWGFIDSDGTEWLERVLAIQDRGPVQADSVWVFMSTVPSGVFHSRAEAEAWIAQTGVHGTLLQLPVGCGSWEYAIRNNRFCPKSSREATPSFIASFCGALEHEHCSSESIDERA